MSTIRRIMLKYLIFSIISSCVTVVDATVYNPCPKQTNSDYLTTADMSIIDTLNTNDLRWVALSRDMLSRWGGCYNYGDTIYVYSKDSDISGEWIVRDCMNARFEKRIDFLQCKRTGLYNKWDNIVISKKNNILLYLFENDLFFKLKDLYLCLKNN